MSLYWFVVVPFLLLAAGMSFIWWLRSLGFFSSRVRQLVEVYREFKEVRLDEFGMLVCAEADDLVNREWRLMHAERRKVAAERIKLARGFLQKIAVNGVLTLEVARFEIREIEQETGKRLLERNALPARLFDRAVMCHFMARVCLARMNFLAFLMIAWPFYVPDFSGRFEVRGYSLIAWYEHMVEEVLEVASEDACDWVYDNTLFMLTGLVEIPEE